jgi:hypothetical protein
MEQKMEFLKAAKEEREGRHKDFLARWDADSKAWREEII